MMLPCYETYKRMVGARGGVWPELVNDGSIELAVKLSADLAKAVLKGAPVTLVAAALPIGDKNVRVVRFGLRAILIVWIIFWRSGGSGQESAAATARKSSFGNRTTLRRF